MRTTDLPSSEGGRRAYFKSGGETVETLSSCISKGSMRSRLARNSLRHEYCPFQCLLNFRDTPDNHTIS